MSKAASGFLFTGKNEIQHFLYQQRVNNLAQNPFPSLSGAMAPSGF